MSRHLNLYFCEALTTVKRHLGILTNTDVWVNLQQTYDLKTAERKVGETIRMVVKMRVT